MSRKIVKSMLFGLALGAFTAAFEGSASAQRWRNRGVYSAPVTRYYNSTPRYYSARPSYNNGYYRNGVYSNGAYSNAPYGTTSYGNSYYGNGYGNGTVYSSGYGTYNTPQQAQGANVGANIGGVIGGYQGANVGAAIGAAVNSGR
jgi:restriction endonuclease S subunit